MSGRGALLKKLYEAKTGQENTVPPVPQQHDEEKRPGTPASSSDVCAPRTTGGRGRSALLASLSGPGLSQSGQAGSDQSISSAPVGRGRGALLQELSKSPMGFVPPSRPVSNLTESPKPTPPVKSAGSHSHTTSSSNIEQSIATLSLSEPVVKRGTTGKRFKATANYVALEVEQDRGIFEYEVRFDPMLDHKAFRCRILNHHIKPKRGVRCFDGGDKLYLPQRLPGGDRLTFSSEHPSDNTPVDMILIYKRQLALKDSTHFYNILFNNIQKVLELARLGRHHFDCKSLISIPQHKLEVWPGYITAIDEYEGGVYLCCDTTHRVLRTETPYEVMTLISNSSRDYKAEIIKQLVGEVVLTRYNNKTYRIDDIIFDQNPQSTFPLRDGSSMSYIDYYKKTYNLTIKDPRQPLLLNKAKKKRQGEEVETCISLIPEFCYLTGLTDKMRSDFQLMKSVATVTRVSPQNKQLGFKRFIRNILDNPSAKQMLADWGLRLDVDPVQLDARVLNPEPIMFGKGMKLEGQARAMWTKQSKSYSVLRAVDIKYWAMIYTQRDTQRAKMFINVMRKVSPAMGFEVNEPIAIAMRDDRIPTFCDSLRRVIQENREKLQIVVTLCPTSRDDRYAAIKKTCCVDYPIPSQVVNSNTIAREDKARPVIQNIALQMNCKLGGALWTISLPVSNAMVCGIDTYHEPGRRHNSVGGFVASMDSQYSKWFSRCFIQAPGQELITGLNACFGATLTAYLRNNKTLPDVIIVFRDGVGDGQLDLCSKVEVEQFLKTCSDMSPNYRPKLTFIVVQKRINTKFVAQLDQAGNNLQNVEPGAVLDHSVTRRNYYDFFLVSQYVTQGTATPSHYIVLHDGNDFKPDHMQRLAYKFCHLYYNWPGTIRVPAPCQYAHRLAQLVGLHLKKLPSNDLEDVLFYL